MKLPLYTQSARDSENVAASAEDLINYYPEAGAGDGVATFNLKPVLGEAILASTGRSLPRDVIASRGLIYGSFNGDLISIDPQTGNAQHLGDITASNETTLSTNGANIVAAAGGNYYVWDGSSLSTPGGGLLGSVGSVEFMDQYTILTEKGGERFEWTTLGDPTTRNALHFATADGRDDLVLRPLAHGRILYLFGERSVEAWYNTGASGSGAFTRLAGGVLDEGLKGYKLAVKADDGIFFVSNDNTAKFLAGNTVATVSTPPVHSDIAASTPTRVSTYEDRGQTFFCIHFADRPAQCLGAETRLWHRRASGVDEPWQTEHTVFAEGRWHAVNSSGDVFRMQRTSTDFAAPLRRVCTSKPLYMGGNKFSVRKLEFLCRMGASNLGRDAKVQLRVSEDGGKTWRGPIDGVIGSQGEYDRQVEFYGLGVYERFNAQLIITDAADVTVYSDANVEVG